MVMTSVEITGKTLTIEEVVKVAYNRATLKPLSEETKERMHATQAWLGEAIKNKETVFYGINTGFGSHANETISPDQAGILSRNVILADVAGVGQPLPKAIVRAYHSWRAFRNSAGGGGNPDGDAQ
jgi:histidine ammonia-lyase